MSTVKQVSIVEKFAILIGKAFVAVLVFFTVIWPASAVLHIVTGLISEFGVYALERLGFL